MQTRQVVPILNVSNLEDSFTWFTRLGWAKNWDHSPDATPTFGSVGSGEVEIFLCVNGQGGRGEDGVWLAIMVDDVDAVHAACVRERLDVLHPPREEPWGMREMLVRHPDGHVFRVGQSSHVHEHPHPHEHEHPH